MTKSVAQKLLIKAGNQVRLINAPEDYQATLGDIPKNVAFVESGEADVVQLFVSSISDLEQSISDALDSLKDNGILWISYPKKSSKIAPDISRDVGWDALKAFNYRPVTQISIDDTWSALRWRPEDQVGT